MTLLVCYAYADLRTPDLQAYRKLDYFSPDSINVNLMRKPLNDLLRSMITTFILMVVTYLICGFYYEEYEAFFDAFYSGKMSPGTPFYSWYYMGNIGLSYLYTPLYGLLPDVEWMSWILYFYLFLSFSLILYLAGYLLRGYGSLWVLSAQAFIYIVVLSDNAIHFHYTRVAYFMCGSSLLALVVLFRDRGSIRAKPFLFTALIFFFLIGTLTRLESSLGATSLLFVCALVYQGAIWHTIRVFILPVIIAGCVMGGIFYDIAHTREFYKRVEPDIETTITCRENYVPLSTMKTAVDSIKYEAAINMMWGDPKVVTPEFMRSLLTTDSYFFSDTIQWHRVFGIMSALCTKYWYYIVFNLLLLGIFIAGTYERRSWPHIFMLFCYQAAFWFLALTETYFVKINDRAFLPFISLYSLGNLFITFYYDSGIIRRYSYVAIAVMLVFLQCRYIAADCSILHQERLTIRSNLRRLEEKTGRNILVLNASSFRFITLANEPFRPFDFSFFDRVYVNEAQVTPTVHTYHEYLQKECGCDVTDFSRFFLFLQRSHRPVYLLSTSFRMRLILDYLHIIRHCDLELHEVRIPGFQKVYNHEMTDMIDLKLYELKRIE